MIVKATEIKNNFGKYLKQLEKEDILVTKNGSPVARISKCSDWGRLDGDGGESIMKEAEAAYKSNGIKMTFEEFLEFREKTEDRYEYIDGEAFLMASPKVTHQQIIGNLYVMLRLWFKGKKCMPYLSPFDVVLIRDEKNKNLVQPDILVVCDPENKNEKDWYTGTPSLVIEVLSDSSRRMDMIRKLNLYMDTGISEYWLVNHFAGEVMVYSFTNKDLAGMTVYRKGDVLKSILFEGLNAELGDIFE